LNLIISDEITLTLTANFPFSDASQYTKYRFLDHYGHPSNERGYNKPEAGSSDEEKNGEGNAIYHIKNNMYTT
jgi:hypothetical protein